MNQPAPPPFAAARAAACRVAPVVLLVLLVLLAMSLGSGSASAGAAEPRTSASAPVEPVGESQPEEADTEPTASGRAGRAAQRCHARSPERGRAAAPCAWSRPCPGLADPSSYPLRAGGPAQLPLPLRTVRCVVLRC